MTNEDIIYFVKLTKFAKIPTRVTPYCAGLDLFASKAVHVPPLGRVLVPTDLRMVLPKGTYGRVAPITGLTIRTGMQIGAGVVDRDYRGPLKVVVFNLSGRGINIGLGDRFAQLVVEKISMPLVEEVVDLTEDLRGE
jgi:dUTP pyrophosphatase